MKGASVLRRGSVMAVHVIKKRKRALTVLAVILCAAMVLAGSAVVSENSKTQLAEVPCDWPAGVAYGCEMPRVDEPRKFFGYDYGSKFHVHEYGKVRLPWPNNASVQWPVCPPPPPMACFKNETNAELRVVVVFIIIAIVGWLTSTKCSRKKLCRKSSVVPSELQRSESVQQPPQESSKQLIHTICLMLVVAVAWFSFNSHTPPGFDDNEALFFTPAYRLNQTCGFSMGRPIFQSFEGAMATILVVLLTSLIPQVAESKLDRSIQGEFDAFVHERMPMFFFSDFQVQVIVTVKSVGNPPPQPKTKRDNQRSLAHEFKGMTGNLVSPQVDEACALEVELADGVLRRFHRRDLELSSHDKILRDHAALEASMDSRARFLSDFVPFAAIWIQVAALICGMIGISEQYQSGHGLNCGWLYFISLPYYLPVLQPWACICMCGTKQIFSAISLQHHLDDGSEFDAQARAPKSTTGIPSLVNFRRASFVFNELQVQLMGKEAQPEHHKKTVALPSSRLATLNANIDEEEHRIRSRVKAMKWRLALAAATYSVYMIPLCLYILPAILLFAPVVMCMVLMEGIWMVIFCGVILFITTVVAMVLKRNQKFAIPFLKTGATLTTASAFIVTLPLLLLPLSMNCAAYYSGEPYMDVSQWFMWHLKDIYLIGRDQNFEIPLIHFSIDFNSLPIGRLALTLSSLAVYLDLASTVLHRIVQGSLSKWNIIKTEPRALKQWKEAIAGACLTVALGFGVGFIVANSVDNVPFAASPLACGFYGLVVGTILGSYSGLGYCDVDETKKFPMNAEGFEDRLVIGFFLQAYTTVSHEKEWHDCKIVKRTEYDVKVQFNKVKGEAEIESKWFPKHSHLLRKRTDVRKEGLNV